MAEQDPENEEDSSARDHESNIRLEDRIINEVASPHSQE
jgi:hypothetical protein